MNMGILLLNRVMAILRYIGIVGGCTFFVSCGGGIPVQVRVDQFTVDIDLDEWVDKAFLELAASGVMPPGSIALPEIWPDSLPTIQYQTTMTTPPVGIDLTPPKDDPNYEKFKEVEKIDQALNRIELNHLIMRVEQTTLTIDLPELALQIADKADASPDDRRAWRTVGFLPGTAGKELPGDMEFTFIPGGETYFLKQLMDEEKDFSIRVRGDIGIDTAENPLRPSGKATLRMIAVVTFMIDPQGSIKVAKDANNAQKSSGVGTGLGGGGTEAGSSTSVN